MKVCSGFFSYFEPKRDRCKLLFSLSWHCCVVSAFPLRLGLRTIKNRHVCILFSFCQQSPLWNVHLCCSFFILSFVLVLCLFDGSKGWHVVFLLIRTKCMLPFPNPSGRVLLFVPFLKHTIFHPHDCFLMCFVSLFFDECLELWKLCEGHQHEWRFNCCQNY